MKSDHYAFLERFSRIFCEELLGAWLITSLAQVREVTATWLEPCNTKRPHDSLALVPPLKFLPRPTRAPASRYPLPA